MICLTVNLQTEDFRKGIKKYEVIVEKSLSEEKYLEKKNFVYLGFVFTVKLATVQISRQRNKFLAMESESSRSRRELVT